MCALLYSGNFNGNEFVDCCDDMDDVVSATIFYRWADAEHMTCDALCDCTYHGWFLGRAAPSASNAGSCPSILTDIYM